MSPEPSLDVDVPSPSATAWRVAILRAPGRASRLTAADVAHQLRKTGSVVVELDAGRFTPDHPEISRHAQAGPQALVIQVGRRVPAAVRLAAELGVPLLRLDMPLPSSVPDTVRKALAAQALGTDPVLDVSLDGASMLPTGPSVSGMGQR